MTVKSKAKKATSGRKLCRYVMQFNRSADLEGVFVVSPLAWETLQALEGQTVYYGEICGKHSDVNCDFSISDIEIVSENDDEIEFFERMFPSGSGFDFLSCWIDYDEASEAGGVAYRSGTWQDPEEALADSDNKRYCGKLLRDYFIGGWDFAASRHGS